MSAEGEIIGDEYPELVVDVESIKQQIKLRSNGDKWGFNTTKSMKEYKFPVYPNEKFIPEGVVWNRLSENYSARYINKPLKIVEYHEGGLTANNVLIRMKSPKGTALAYKEQLSLPIGIRSKSKAAINYVRFALHGRLFLNIATVALYNPLVFIALPAGCVFFVYDKLKNRAI